MKFVTTVLAFLLFLPFPSLSFPLAASGGDDPNAACKPGGYVIESLQLYRYTYPRKSPKGQLWFTFTIPLSLENPITAHCMTRNQGGAPLGLVELTQNTWYSGDGTVGFRIMNAGDMINVVPFWICQEKTWFDQFNYTVPWTCEIHDTADETVEACTARGPYLIHANNPRIFTIGG